MIELPSWIPPSNNGTPIPRVSRVDRKSAKAVRKAKEDAEIVEAVKAAKPKRKAIGARLRAMVLERDGMACTRCGQTAGPGVTLHVDHVEPVASGGTNCETNLRTLCSECNLGRGARSDPKPVTVDNNKIVAQLAAIVGKKKK